MIYGNGKKLHKSCPMYSDSRPIKIGPSSRSTRDVVTAIELLSLTNKRESRAPRSLIWPQRSAVRGRDAHPVEINQLSARRVKARRRSPRAHVRRLREPRRRATDRRLLALRTFDPLPTILVPLQSGQRDARRDHRRLADDFMPTGRLTNRGRRQFRLWR